MAQHFKIEEWKDQEWYPLLMDTIKNIVSIIDKKETNENIFLLPDEYKMQDDTDRVFGFRPSSKFDMVIDNENEIQVNQIGIEIHVDKDNIIQQVYLPL